MSKTILIVDDSDAQRQVIKMNLTRSGYEVIEANNGQAALDLLASQKPKIQLIISDVNMPQVNGIEFVRKIKAGEDYKFTPIIMLTTESQEQLKQEGLELGVKAWLVKPFKNEQLMSAISKLIL